MVSWKAGVVLAAVLIGLAAYLVATRPRPAPPQPRLMPCGVNEALSLEIKGQARTLRLQRPDTRSEWRLVLPRPGPADHTAAVYLVSAVESVRALNTIDRPQAAAAYGFDNPHDVVTCRVSQGASYTLTVGNRSFDRSGYYAQKGGDNRVYVISGVEVDSIDRALVAPPVKPSPSSGA